MFDVFFHCLAVYDYVYQLDETTRPFIFWNYEVQRAETFNVKLISRMALRCLGMYLVTYYRCSFYICSPNWYLKIARKYIQGRHLQASRNTRPCGKVYNCLSRKLSLTSGSRYKNKFSIFLRCEGDWF